MFKPHISSLINYNVIISLKSLAFKSIKVTKSVLVQFLTFFKNAFRQGKAFNFDTVQSNWPSSWISKKVLLNTYDITDHVQS